ncbi:MAG: 50S ribosomal protein L20 [Pseudomonadota bacterium]
MPRSKKGTVNRRRHNKLLKKAKGYFSARHRLVRTALNAVDKALKYAYVGRKLKKRDFRALWNVRIGAAAKELGFSYSRLIGGLKKKNIEINRKMLAELAMNNPDDFKTLVETACAQ